METGFNSSNNRPISSLSLLAEQLSESACIYDNSEIDSTRLNQNNLQREIISRRKSTDSEEILSSSCPHTNLYLAASIPCFDSSSPPCIPPKRHCDSLNDEPRSLLEKSPPSGLARPIPLRPTVLKGDCSELSGASQTSLSASTPSESTPPPVDSAAATTPGSRIGCLFSRSSSLGQPSRCFHRHYSRAHSFGLSKLQILPHAKSRSAFTPTRSIISPRASSDYSLSPEIDSPLQRPASVQSSGFHEENSFQSLIETSSLPDCSQIVSRNSSSRIRCNSQPNLNPSPSISTFCSQCSALLANKKSLYMQLPMKRRRDVTRDSSTPLSSNSSASTGPSNFCSTPLEQIKNQLTSTRSPDVFYFSSSRPYLVSLSQLSYSPPVPNSRRSGKFGKPSTILEHVPLSSSGGRGSQASTLTASSTGTPTNSRENMLQALSQSGEASYSDQVEESCRSSSLDFETSMTSEMDYSRDECSKFSHDESTEEIPHTDDSNSSKIFRPVVLADSAASHTIASVQLHPFQELDLDQIEND